MRQDTVIAWDFDGVLNRNIVDGKFLWAQRFEGDLGQSREVFERHIFGHDFDRVITGEQDLRDRVAEWAAAVGFADGPDALLAYWFQKDDLPDPQMLGLMRDVHGHGIRQVIATNNETRRASYIETATPFASLIERMFASGRMGTRKPRPDYFRQITDALSVPPSAMVLVDDSQANVDQARHLGWQAYFFDDSTRDAVIAHITTMLPRV